METTAASLHITKDTTANPAPLGLLGFGMTTVLLNLHNAGLFLLDTMILGMGQFFRGHSADFRRYYGMEERQYFRYYSIYGLRPILDESGGAACVSRNRMGCGAKQCCNDGIPFYLGPIHCCHVCGDT